MLKSEISEAQHLIDPLIQKHPYHSELNEIYCLILLKKNNLKNAELRAKNFLKNNISSTFPLPFLAESARVKGNYRASVLYWQLYRNSFPIDPYANLALIELYSDLNMDKELDEELTKLLCLKKTLSLNSYINELSRNKNLLVYVPDYNKIQKIVKTRKTIH